jgi:hypothetical protein
MLTVHVFRCFEAPALCGYTLDQTGVNLPAQVAEGRWTYFTSLQVEPSQDRIGVDARALVRDVEAHGYHLARSGVPLLPDGSEAPRKGGKV